MNIKRLIEALHGLANILYVGGILSHIVIGAIFVNASPEVVVTIYTYKLQSAYILILPGLGLKILTDIVLYFVYQERAWWMKIKLAATAFLTINAFVFLVPMMPDLLTLATLSIPDGVISDEFHRLEGWEILVGMSNIVPLATELVMGAFKPAISKREKSREGY